MLGSMLSARCVSSLPASHGICAPFLARGARSLPPLDTPLQLRSPLIRPRAAPNDPGTSRAVDLVLSSGFLAFAKHAGFLQAVEDAELPIGGIMGTSSGAYAGSLYCAGYTPQQIATELCLVPPIVLLRPCWRFWCGLLSLHVVIDRLRELLPPTFEDLDRKFAVGVVDSDGQHTLIDSGPLPEAVAASGAIPVLFAPVNIPGFEGGPYGDGGMRDRVGLVPWREYRRASLPSTVPDTMVHLISRSSPFSGKDDVEAMGERRVSVARSQKSGVSFVAMGDYEVQMRDACDRAAPLVRAMKDRISEPGRRLVA